MGDDVGGSGPAWQAEGNIQSYLDLRPVAAAGTSGGSRGLLTAGIVVAVVIVASVVFVARRRRRHVQVEEDRASGRRRPVDDGAQWVPAVSQLSGTAKSISGRLSGVIGDLAR